jgi:hypothetical protein
MLDMIVLPHDNAADSRPCNDAVAVLMPYNTTRYIHAALTPERQSNQKSDTYIMDSIPPRYSLLYNSMNVMRMLLIPKYQRTSVQDLMFHHRKGPISSRWPWVRHDVR